MQLDAHFLNPGVLPRGVYAVRQKHDKQLPVRINPDRSARKSGMPKAVRRKIMSARSAFGRHRPAQRSRPAGKLLRGRELRDRRVP